MHLRNRKEDNKMNIFATWGFKNNPFKTMPLPPNDNGLLLLVGRNNELSKIKRRLVNTSNIITIEGNNGVGKTSLINVASYELYKNYIETGEGSFFIPCDTCFQLAPDKDIEDFIDEVLFEIAQTLLRIGKQLKTHGYKLEGSKSIDNWLNSPLIETYSGNVWMLGGGKSSSENTSLGFQRSGFRLKILNWIKDIFPYRQNGGIICTIDNIELLQTSSMARKQLEQLRDTLFGYQGIRWVLCGSLGIVMGVASSPRLEGRLSDPIEINGVDERYTADILKSRISHYAINKEDYYLPLLEDDFVHLYNILNKNIRNTLNYANNYCLWIADENIKPLEQEDKKEAYKKWLDIRSSKKLLSIKQEIRPRAMEVFKKSIEMRGTFSPSDYEYFGFKNFQAFRPHINRLENAGLVSSSIDESDKRRKTIQVTPEGWFLNYALSKTKA